jgi:hypothetical protein
LDDRDDPIDARKHEHHRHVVASGQVRYDGVGSGDLGIGARLRQQLLVLLEDVDRLHLVH